VPAGPHLGELGRGALQVAHLGLDVRAIDRLPVERALALAVLRGKVGGDGVELVGGTGGGRRRQHDAVAQDIELARDHRVEPLHLRVFRRVERVADRLLGADRAVTRVERVGVVGDVGRVDPCNARRLDREPEQVLLDRGDEIGRPLRRHRIGRRGGFGGCRLLRGGGRGEARRPSASTANGSKKLHLGIVLISRMENGYDRYGLNLQRG
jgi:hypothetical protein